MYAFISLAEAEAEARTTSDLWIDPATIDATDNLKNSWYGGMMNQYEELCAWVDAQGWNEIAAHQYKDCALEIMSGYHFGLVTAMEKSDKDPELLGYCEACDLVASSLQAGEIPTDNALLAELFQED